MKSLSYLKICFLGVLVLGLTVSYLEAVPQSLGDDQSVSLTGGTCRECWEYVCPQDCENSVYHRCVGTSDELCCKQATQPDWGCGPGGPGCSTYECCDYSCGESPCTIGEE